MLHPLFVSDKCSESMRIGAMADPHVCVRADLFEINLKDAGVAVKKYANYNSIFRELYGKAKSNCDAILFLGDLIDYGRGHNAQNINVSMGKDEYYVLDRNWFPFYSLLASQDNYTRPTYTVLGNHDWRFHPYGPINPFFSIAADLNLNKEQVKLAHGDNADAVWYAKFLECQTVADYFRRIPLITDLDSIKWYLLLINPFLDYVANVPGEYRFLMLDWAENEQIFGADFPQRTGLPLAEDSLTEIQKSLVTWFVGLASTKPWGCMLPSLGQDPNGPETTLSRE